MALKLDDNLLVELGLGALPPEEKKSFLAHIYETLEMRVGVRLAEQMSEQQLSEFEALINTGNEAGAFQWLETTFPGYKEVVAEEFEKLKGEIAQVSPQILASSQQQAAQTPQQTAPDQQPPQASGQQYSPQPGQSAQPQYPTPPSATPVPQTPAQPQDGQPDPGFYQQPPQ